MGDVAFGDGFQLLRDGDKNGLWKNLSDRLEYVVPFPNTNNGVFFPCPLIYFRLSTLLLLIISVTFGT